MACGWDVVGQRGPPALVAGLTYRQAAAGGCHAVLLRSEGTAVARGWIIAGRTDLSAMVANLNCKQVGAGSGLAVLLQSPE